MNKKIKEITFESLLLIFQDILECEISLDKKLVDMGLDSLYAFDIVAELNKISDKEIGFDVIFENCSASDVIKNIIELLT